MFFIQFVLNIIKLHKYRWAKHMNFSFNFQLLLFQYKSPTAVILEFKINQGKGQVVQRICHLVEYYTECVGTFSILKMEIVDFSETVAHIYKNHIGKGKAYPLQAWTGPWEIR
jgi:hypothetical protein